MSRIDHVNQPRAQQIILFDRAWTMLHGPTPKLQGSGRNHTKSRRKKPANQPHSSMKTTTCELLRANQVVGAFAGLEDIN
jgi:hypothetical protein